MRLVGLIDDEPRARRLADYLLTLEIPAELRTQRDGTGWGVWVIREDQVEHARREFDAFLRAPDDPRYASAARPAQQLRKQADRREREHRRNTIELRGRLNTISALRCPVTHALILGSVVVALLTGVGADWRTLMPLYFSPPVTEVVAVPIGDGTTLSVPQKVERSSGLDALRRGQLWRLWTPMFIHYGWMHLIFNMSALYGLGGLIELRKGSLLLIALVLAASPVSFLAQYLWDVQRHGFDRPSLPGGMSGVVYALFGYAWMKSDYDPESDIRISSNAIVAMMLWLVLCMTGFLGPIANAAHVGGLVFGLCVGIAPHLIGRRT
jgi:GlpG protein